MLGNHNDDDDEDDGEAGGGGAVKIWLASAPPTLCLGRGWVRQWPMLFLKKYQKNYADHHHHDDIKDHDYIDHCKNAKPSYKSLSWHWGV